MPISKKVRWLVYAAALCLNRGFALVCMFVELVCMFNKPKDHLYFIRSGRRVKIGRTNNVARRLRALQTGSPVTLVVEEVFHGCGYMERALHKKALAYGPRLRGEWFDIADTHELRSTIHIG